MRLTWYLFLLCLLVVFVVPHSRRSRRPLRNRVEDSSEDVESSTTSNSLSLGNSSSTEVLESSIESNSSSLSNSSDTSRRRTYTGRSRFGRRKHVYYPEFMRATSAVSSRRRGCWVNSRVSLSKYNNNRERRRYYGRRRSHGGFRSRNGSYSGSSHFRRRYPTNMHNLTSHIVTTTTDAITSVEPYLTTREGYSHFRWRYPTNMHNLTSHIVPTSTDTITSIKPYLTTTESSLNIYWPYPGIPYLRLVSTTNTYNLKSIEPTSTDATNIIKAPIITDDDHIPSATPVIKSIEAVLVS